jgi:hypothetical protein
VDLCSFIAGPDLPLEDVQAPAIQMAASGRGDACKVGSVFRDLAKAEPHDRVGENCKEPIADRQW